MLLEGQRHTVTVEALASQGQGVARIDGQVVFVKGALPGETCRIVLEHVGHRAAWAGVEAIPAPSPDRVAPDCPYYAQCGGCQTRHMTYEAELAFKAGKVREALTRIGGADPGAVLIHGSAATARYRNKVQFPVAAGPKVGFYRERSHRVVDVADCLLQPEGAGPLAQALRTWMRRWNVPAYDERGHKGLVRHLFLRSARSGVLCCIVANGHSLPREDELVELLRAAEPKLTGISLNGNTRRGNVILGQEYRTLWGEDFLLDELCGLTFRLSVPSFYQVNRPQAEALYGLAGEFAGLTGGETVLDLYCGTGTIGLTLAKQAGQIIGVEIVPQAVEDAWENARRNGLANVRYLCGDAAQAAAQLAREGVRPQVAVVDPPRKGLAPDVIEILLQMSPRRIIYLSCDCATLARDVKALSPAYTLTRAEAVDMFPRTVHVETVALLSRGESQSK